MADIDVNSLLAFLWAFSISVFAIPSIIHVAHIKNLLDEPNFRTVHSSLTPRLGGLAIYAGFISAVTIFGNLNGDIQKILAGSLLLFFIGLKDDILAISPFKKFFVQFVATSILVFMSNVRLTSLQGFMGIYELPDGLSYGLTFIAVVGITNAINLIDGLDGLAGSLSVIISATFGFFFYHHGNIAMATLCFALIGGIVGFLRYNIHKAIIFMGDTGSLVLGFLISVFAIQFVQMDTVQSAPALAIAILIVPLFDTTRVFTIRILQGKSPFSPDKNHIHHVLTKFGFSQLATVITLVGVNGIMVLITASLANYGTDVLIFGLLLSFVAGSVVLERMNRSSRKRLERTQAHAQMASQKTAV